MTTTGCRARGCWRRKWDFCGRRVGGVGAAALSFGTKGIGDRWSDFMAASTMDSVISGAVMKEDAGTTTVFITTDR